MMILVLLVSSSIIKEALALLITTQRCSWPTICAVVVEEVQG